MSIRVHPWFSLFRGFALLLFLGLGAILVGGLVMLLGGGSRSVTLQNGITLHCLGVSYGTNHVVYVGSAAERVLHRIQGAVFPRLRPGGPGTQRHLTSQPALVVWVRQERAATTNRMAPLSLTALLADGRGVTAGKRHWLTLGAGFAGAVWLEADVLPRRSRTLSLRFFGPTHPNTLAPLGELEVPNPAFAKPPPLIAEPLPILRTNGAVECRLDALAFGTGISSRRRTKSDGTEAFSESAAPPGAEVRATAVFRFREHDTNTTFWTIGSLTVSDATGNAVKAVSYSSQTLKDALVLTFGPVPWPDEPWRLDCWAKRATTAPFPPDELVSLRDVELPPTGRTNQLDHAAGPSGIRIVVKGFVRRAPLEGGSYSSDDLSRLLLEVAELPEGAFVDLVRVEDDQGRIVTSDMTSTTHGTPLKIEFGFRAIPENARTLSFTLAVHRGRAFSFVAQPQVVGTNGFEFKFPR